MTTQEKIKEVEKRIRNSTSYKNRNDLMKYKKVVKAIEERGYLKLMKLISI